MGAALGMIGTIMSAKDAVGGGEQEGALPSSPKAPSISLNGGAGAGSGNSGLGAIERYIKMLEMTNQTDRRGR